MQKTMAWVTDVREVQVFGRPVAHLDEARPGRKEHWIQVCTGMQDMLQLLAGLQHLCCP